MFGFGRHERRDHERPRNGRPRLERPRLERPRDERLAERKRDRGQDRSPDRDRPRPRDRANDREDSPIPPRPRPESRLDQTDRHHDGDRHRDCDRQSDRDSSNGKSASSSRSRLTGSQALARAKRFLTELTGNVAESVSSLTRSRDGWRIALEVIELERIPRTTDILGSYLVQLDENGELISCQRVHRYYRNEVSSET